MLPRPHSASLLPPPRRAAAYQCPGRQWLRNDAQARHHRAVTSRPAARRSLHTSRPITALTADQLLEQNVVRSHTSRVRSEHSSAGSRTTHAQRYIRGVANDRCGPRTASASPDDVYIALPQGACSTCTRRCIECCAPQHPRQTRSRAPSSTSGDIVTEDPGQRHATGCSYATRHQSGVGAIVADHVTSAPLSYLRRDGYRGRQRLRTARSIAWGRIFGKDVLAADQATCLGRELEAAVWPIPP